MTRGIQMGLRKSTLVGLIFLAIPLISYASINTNLNYGSTGAQVVELQAFLINKGYLQGTATGNFYSLTQQAVENFQSANGISSTGYVGSLTRAAINAEISGQNNSLQTTVSSVSPTTTTCPQEYTCAPVAKSTIKTNTQESTQQQAEYSAIEKVNDAAAQQAVNNETGYQICSQSYPDETWDGTYNNGKYNCVCDTGYVSNGTSCQLPQQSVTPRLSTACQQAEEAFQTAENQANTFNQQNLSTESSLPMEALISSGRGQILGNQLASESQAYANAETYALEEEQVACQ